MADFKKYLLEGVLIVFSVLFALVINKMFEDYKINKKKIIAIESIQKELYRNAAIVGNWKGQHMELSDRITEVVEGENDSLRRELLNYKFLNLSVLTNKETLIDAILTNTAWEAAKSTGIITEFDFELNQKLTYVYSMQEVLMDGTIEKILDSFYEANTFDQDEIDQSLLRFQLLFWDLTRQEDLMKDLYGQAIKETKKYVSVSNEWTE